MDLGLAGQVCLVTGASRGLGRAVALGLAAEGARVALGYRRERAAAEAAAEACRTAGAPAAVALPLDAGSEADVATFFEAAEAALGPAAVLVNNGAVCPRGPAVKVTRPDWDAVLAANLTGPFRLAQELLRRLGARGAPGRIVNVVSTAAFHGSTSGQVAYDASKGGLVSLTMALAREAAPLGVTVNAVAPGLIRTEMMREKFAADPERYLSRVPLRRLAEPEEVAAAVLFLASRQAAYVTGTVLNVSGGLLMR